MKKPEIVDYLDGFIAATNAPVREGVTVRHVAALPAGGYSVDYTVGSSAGTSTGTSTGTVTASQVVVASGGYQTPVIPRFAERLPDGIVQLHSAQYRNPQALPAGDVLVVGSGQSGAQIAEDLHLAGRRVHLATGDAPRCARFYRGKDVVDWLADMGYYDMAVTDHPLREGVRDNTNHYVTGRDGGRDIDLRTFALQGMELYGRVTGLTGDVLEIAQDLRANLDQADKVYNSINASIDKWIAANGVDAPAQAPYAPVWQPQAERTTLDLKEAGIAAVVWCIGFSPDFRWLDAPVFNGRGNPVHLRGITRQPGLYFLGLPWLHTWGSGRFSGIARDAEHLAEAIVVQAAQQGETRKYA